MTGFVQLNARCWGCTSEQEGADDEGSGSGAIKKKSVTVGLFKGGNRRDAVRRNHIIDMGLAYGN